MHKFLAVFISLTLGISTYAEKENDVSSIMLIGNSFFYYNNSLHNHLGDLYDADPELDTPKRRSITINGSALSWHDVESYISNTEIGSFKIDSSTNTYQPYTDRNIDVAIMMDCSLCPINEQRKSSFEKYVKQHSHTLRAKDIEPILFMSWPYKNTPKMQVALEKAFFDAATTNRIRLIPAGPAFFYVNQNFPEINLYTNDNRHPSPAGTYLAALMVFATLTDKSPIGNSYTMGLDKDAAKTLQEVAWLTHQNFQQKN